MSNHYATGSNGNNSNSSNNGLYEVMARGFPWNVKRSDVGAFFSDMKILGEIDGIHIRKNGAMEATFFVDSFEEMQKALEHDKQSFGTRIIHGMHRILFCRENKIFSTKFLYFLPSTVSQVHSKPNSKLSTSLITLI